MTDLDIITLAEGKRALGIETGNTKHDDVLPLWITEASEIMDGLTGPNIIREVSQEFRNPGSGTLILDTYPVVSMTSVTVYSGSTPTVYVEDDAAQAPPPYGYQLNAASGMLELAPSRWGYGTRIRVVYRAGRAETMAGLPATIRVETARLLTHNYQPSQGAGTESYGEVGGLPSFAVPNVVRDNLKAARLLQASPGFA